MLDLPPIALPESGQGNYLPAPEPGEPFICGPLYWHYWALVSSLGTNELRLVSAIKYWSGFRKPVGALKGTRFGLADGWELGLNPYSARHALRSLEVANLVRVARGLGRKPVVVLEDWRACGRDGGRTLYLPIPWIWWFRACPLPGRALRVALALWFQAGWLGGQSRSPFDLGAWGAVGLSRFAASRGLQTLAAARLVAIEHRIGSHPVVELRVDS